MHTRDNETVDQERRQNNTGTKMDMRPKSRADGLHGVKTKSVRPRKQQKFENALKRWLLTPANKASTAEVCQTQEDVEVTEDGGCQSKSLQSQDYPNAEKPPISDSDEETQPLTPGDLCEENPVSPASNDAVGSGLMDTQPHNSSESPEGSVKQKTRITDFFSVTSSPGLPVRRGRLDNFPEKQDADKETTSADVKWLGTPIGELKRMPECGRPLPPLKDVPGQHTVMIKVRAVLFFFRWSM